MAHDGASKDGQSQSLDTLDGKVTERTRRRGTGAATAGYESAVLEALCAMVPALSTFFGRFCEVVVHDLRQPERSIVAIENSHVTGRKLNGPLVGGPFGDVSLRWLRERGVGHKTQVYATRSGDGRTLKSATTLFRNDRGEPFAALCINEDIRAAEVALEFLSEVVNTSAAPTGPTAHDPALPGDVDDILNQMVSDALRTYRQPPLSKDERRALVRDLDDRGAFLIKGAVRKVAEALGVSKFTIYGDLDSGRSP